MNVYNVITPPPPTYVDGYLLLIMFFCSCSVTVSQGDNIAQPAAAAAQPGQRSVNLLDGNISSSDSESSDDSTNHSLPNPMGAAVGASSLPNPMSTQLPSPRINTINRQSTGSSVWANPFLIEERKQDSILQQHVKMTELVPELTKKQKSEVRRNRMTFCHNFKKGRCKLGDKCKFSHNMEEVEALRTSMAQSAAAAANRRAAKMSHKTEHPTDEEERMWEGGAMKQGKKRIGITDTVQPAKKAMKNLTAEREQERPWTVKR